ncbi:MAG: CTP synthase, partial [Candidatus Omnitrophica bacterium]|nr:CTP synthase [Candidatus Omnitrophota bacterium]
VTGGVCSSLGKGVAAATVGTLLEGRGLSVTLQKFDPYLNVDPGTMSPYQHGEVYVTDDGAETDLDLGYYERFTHSEVSRLNSVSTGQIYESVIRRERRGGYLGKTVQVIPHVTDEIKSRVRTLAENTGADVQICEIGGTVGDIESIPFLEAIRQFAHEEGDENVLFIHVTLIPHVPAADELKTKPTQHSVMKLREIGIQPDILLCRCDRPIDEDMKNKLSLFCNVEPGAVLSAQDVTTTIYEIPLAYSKEGIDRIVMEKLKLQGSPLDMSRWEDFVQRVIQPEGTVRIAVVGKYSELQDAYRSIYEALLHGGAAHRYKVEIVKINAEEVEEKGCTELMHGIHGVLIPGGFGTRGIEGKIDVIRYARENEIPFFGICLGMQCATIEVARHLASLENANSTEINPETPHPVISLLEEQMKIEDMGGTMRLGAYHCHLVPGTKAHKAYGVPDMSERHRHRYEFNNKYREKLEDAGLRIAGTSPDGKLVEIVEVPDHPWFVGVQFHPEFTSRPLRPQPLFRDFVGAAVRIAEKQRHPLVSPAADEE